MHNSMKKVLWAASGLFLVLLAFDCFDFLSRWAGHFEPFKNNAERIFYFVVLIAIVWHLRGWLANRVKSLKVFAGGYGLEVDLGMRSDRTDDSELKLQGMRVLTDMNRTFMIGISEQGNLRRWY